MHDDAVALAAVLVANALGDSKPVDLKHGRPAAVLLNAEDLESLEETLSVLSRPELLADVREALVEERAGKAQRLTKNEALGLIKRK